MRLLLILIIKGRFLSQEMAERRHRQVAADRRLISDRTAKGLRTLAAPQRVYRDRGMRGLASRRSLNLTDYLVVPPEEIELDDDIDSLESAVEGARINYDLHDAYTDPTGLCRLMTPAVVPGGVPFTGGPCMPMPSVGSGGPGMPVMSSVQVMPVSIGASLAPRPISMPTAGAGQMVMGIGIPSPGNTIVGGGGVMPWLLLNGYGEYSGLLYHSPHTVMYEDELYPTALHLFEALKFLAHRPDLAYQIRLCEHVEEVTAISALFSHITRREWGDVARSIVRLFF